MRSMRGPESLERYRSIARFETSSVAASPLGVGFMAATSMNEAGKVIAECERAIVIVRSSSGCRSVSSTALGNSGSSSRKSTPWCASEISPGLGTAPPPTIAGVLAVWWGALTGLAVTSERGWCPLLLCSACVVGGGFPAAE